VEPRALARHRVILVDDTENTLGQLFGLEKVWSVVEARLEASPSTLLLKVE